VPLPADMPPDVLIYRWFAATYQWTPAQVDELPLEALIWLPPIEMAAEDVARRARDRDARSAQAHRR
jgi:hypothetical protein